MVRLINCYLLLLTFTGIRTIRFIVPFHRMQRIRKPPLYVLFFGLYIAIMDTGRTTSIVKTSENFPTSLYDDLVIMGPAFGINLGAMAVALPLAFKPKGLGLVTYAQLQKAEASIAAWNGSEQ
jgi:hypothetical protein